MEPTLCQLNYDGDNVSEASIEAEDTVPDPRVWYSDAFSVALCRANPRTLFVFGDNVQKRGNRGQAVINGQPNARGIPTKKSPSQSFDAFFADWEYDWNVEQIHAAHVDILTDWLSGNYDSICLPKEIWGTGLARLPEKAPQTFEYVVEVYRDLQRPSRISRESF